MAWTGTQLSAAVRALAAANKPLVFANVLLRSLVAANFRWNQTGSWATGDSTDTTLGPTTYANDDDQTLRTRPLTSQATWYFLWDLGANTALTFDSIALLNHNFATTGDCTITVQIADSSDYATALKTLATITPGTSTKRLVGLVLDHTGGSTATSYSGGRWGRIKIVSASSILPQFSELVIGARRQLQFQPDEPYNDEDLKTAVQRFTSSSGRKINNTLYKGERHIDARLSPSETAYIDDLRNFWKTDTDMGSRPFVWVDQPAAAPQSAPFMLFDDPRLSGIWVGPFEKAFAPVMTEQAQPFVVNEA